MSFPALVAHEYWYLTRKKGGLSCVEVCGLRPEQAAVESQRQTPQGPFTHSTHLLKAPLSLHVVSCWFSRKSAQRRLFWGVCLGT